MKFKRFVLLVSIMCILSCTTGCGETLYTMTTDEETIVTLYAAKMVSKFNKNQTTGICNARIRDGELDDAYGTTDDEAATDESDTLEDDATDLTEEVTVDPETGEEIISDTDSETSEETQEDVVSTDSGYSFTDAIGIDGMEFTCSKFEISNEFKPSSSFVLSAVSGKKYLVLTIQGTNTSDSTIDFSDVATRKYSLSLNGGNASSSQYTPLSNDLSQYDGSLAVGESKTFILVFLFSDSSVENITSLELYVDSDGSTRGTAI